MEQAQSTPLSVTLADVDLTLRQTSPSEPIELRSRVRLAGAAIGQIEAKAQIVLGDRSGPSLDGTATLTGVEFKAWQAVLAGGHDGPPFTGPFSGEVRLAGGPLARSTFSGSLNLKPTGVRIGGAFHKPAGEDAQVAFQGQREDRGSCFTKVAVAFRDMTLGGDRAPPRPEGPPDQLHGLVAPVAAGPFAGARAGAADPNLLGPGVGGSPESGTSAAGGATGLSAQGRGERGRG